MDDGGWVVLGPAARELRRALRPIEWVVLEDVALDARRDDAGALVAPTSARRVGEHLGLTPGAVARALARLRAAGLVSHTRQAGPAGRFGLSAYVLNAVPGLDVMPATPDGDRPCPAPPCPAPPHVDPSRAVDAHMVEAEGAGSEAPDVPGSARRSLHDDVARALAAAVDNLASEERPRSSQRRSSARSQRRPASQSATTQLSILDATIGSERNTNSDRQP
jgi:hypothetical protein